MSLHRERGQHEHRQRYAETPIQVDHTLAMAEYVGAANGLSDAELRQVEHQLQGIDAKIKGWRQSGRPGFWTLPYDTALVKEIKSRAKQLKEWCRDALVVGLGEAALSAQALRQALLHPSHNLFPLGRRHYHSRLFIAASVEPDSLYGFLDGLELKRLAVNVISKSGEEPELLALFAFIYQILENRLGPAQAKESCLLILPETPSSLSRLAVREGFPYLTVPAAVTGCEGILAASGLFPAALAGIDIDGLLAGARYMDQRLQEAPLQDHAAYRLAACYYLLHRLKGRTFHLILPYADSLPGLAAWGSQLWDMRLGQAEPGLTSAWGRGPAEQYTTVARLCRANSQHIVTFWEVEKFHQNISVPALFPQEAEEAYLGGQPLAAVLTAAKQAAACRLAEVGCPNLTIRLPEVNAFTIGQLIYLLEMSVVALGELLGVDTLAQSPGQDILETTCGLLGHPGHAAAASAGTQTGAPKQTCIV